jgi:hypothetical protein
LCNPVETHGDIHSGEGEGDGASPTHGVVVRPKTIVAVAVRGQGSGGGGAVLHGDRGGSGNRMQKGQNKIGKSIP